MIRIASTQFHATMNTALQKASGTVGILMQQMSSGQRLLVPSDDPVTSVRLARLNREEAAIGQYRANIAALKSRLQQNESTLDGMTKDLLQARDLLVWAADGSNTSQDLNAMVSSLNSLRNSLLSTADTRDHEGRYLFSGTVLTSPPVTYDPTAAIGSRYTFTGNTERQDVVVGNGITQTANVTLAEMATLLNQLDNAEAVLQTPGVNINDPANHGVVETALNGVDSALDAITGKVAELGGAQNTLQTLDDNHANVSLSNQQARTTLGQLDYSEAAVRMNAYQAALAATQKAYGKVSALSLFDAI